jgi:hypothetical protein
MLAAAHMRRPWAQYHGVCLGDSTTGHCTGSLCTGQMRPDATKRTCLRHGMRTTEWRQLVRPVAALTCSPPGIFSADLFEADRRVCTCSSEDEPDKCRSMVRTNDLDDVFAAFYARTREMRSHFDGTVLVGSHGCCTTRQVRLILQLHRDCADRSAQNFLRQVRVAKLSSMALV